VNPKPTTNLIAAMCIAGAIGLTVFIFSASRNDSGLRMAALVSSTSIAAALLTIASTMLVGKDVTKPDAADLPPGSTLHTTQQTDIKSETPPVPKTQA
jgi:hypothetical protein